MCVLESGNFSKMDRFVPSLDEVYVHRYVASTYACKLYYTNPTQDTPTQAYDYNKISPRKDQNILICCGTIFV